MNCIISPKYHDYIGKLRLEELEAELGALERIINETLWAINGAIDDEKSHNVVEKLRLNVSDLRNKVTTIEKIIEEKKLN